MTILHITSWDELSSHQAEAVSLNLASSYGYITTFKSLGGGWGAIIAQVGFNLHCVFRQFGIFFNLGVPGEGYNFEIAV